MKTIIVNESEILKNSRSDFSVKRLNFMINKICIFFLDHRVRNKKLLKIKKELTVVFLSTSEMKNINKIFRKKNKATDILSFKSGDDSSLGELLLCLDVLKKQAREQGHSLDHEISYMLIHGILHLLGYDHELSNREEQLMFALQDRCFSVLSATILNQKV